MNISNLNFGLISEERDIVPNFKSKMAESIKHLAKRMCILGLVHGIYTFLGALLFIYIEECNAVKTHGQEYNRFKSYLSEHKQLNSSEAEMILNISTGFFDPDLKHDCAITKKTLVKWWDFTMISCATIGEYLLKIAYSPWGTSVWYWGRYSALNIIGEDVQYCRRCSLYIRGCSVMCMMFSTDLLFVSAVLIMIHSSNVIPPQY